MPIDPRIALGVQQQQMPTFLDLAGQAAQVRNLQAQPALQQQQMRLNDLRIQGAQQDLYQQGLAMEAAKRKEAGIAALSELWGQYGDDDNQIIAGLNQRGFADMAQAFAEDRAKVKKEVFAAEKDKVETQSKQVALAGQILGSINDEQTLVRGVGQALANGLLDAQSAQQWLAGGWNEQTAAKVAQVRQQALTAQQQIDEIRKKAEDAAKKLEDPLKLRKLEAETKKAEREATGSPDTSDIQNYRFAQSQGYAGTFEQWQKDEANRKTPRTTVNMGAMAPGDAELVRTVMANPAYWENLTPTAKTRIGPALAAAGFTDFGKAATTGELEEVAGLSEAIESVESLNKKLPSNAGLFGPFVGRTGAMNPYNESAQAMQAELNLIKQRVGKALEGGVLRKEDEEKYKRILPVLTDTPEVAAGKIRQLSGMLRKDLMVYQKTAKQAGRRSMGDGAVQSGKGAPVVGGMFNGKKILAVEKVE